MSKYNAWIGFTIWNGWKLNCTVHPHTRLKFALINVINRITLREWERKSGKREKNLQKLIILGHLSAANIVNNDGWFSQFEMVCDVCLSAAAKRSKNSSLNQNKCSMLWRAYIFFLCWLLAYLCCAHETKSIDLNWEWNA